MSQPPDGTDGRGCEKGIDGYVPESFEPATLAEAVTGLATAIARTADAPAQEGSNAPLFDATEFRAQVGFDEDLMRELIDLFLNESPCQVVEMREALTAGDFDRLARVAHTLKGSFATFHAAQARTRAQQLETASKAAEAPECRQLLSLLEHDLELLEPELLALRDGSASR
jgi:HPt (histidine-containing phosphotransfer) domain-containing protein